MYGEPRTQILHVAIGAQISLVQNLPFGTSLRFAR